MPLPGTVELTVKPQSGYYIWTIWVNDSGWNRDAIKGASWSYKGACREGKRALKRYHKNNQVIIESVVVDREAYNAYLEKKNND